MKTKQLKSGQYVLCTKCKYMWPPRIFPDYPKSCPKCKRYNWREE